MTPASPQLALNHDLAQFSSARIVHLAELLTKVADQHLNKKCHLTIAQFKVLFLLHTKGQLTQDELAAYLGLTPAAISRQSTFLVKKKVINRQTNPQNRRQNYLFLTKFGEEQVQTAFGIISELEKKLFENQSATEHATFLNTATALIKKLHQCSECP